MSIRKPKRPATLRARAARKSTTSSAAKSWTLRAAKTRFSEVVRLAQKQPQRITCRGADAVIVLSAAEYGRLCRRPKPKRSLFEFLASGPFAGLDLERRFEPSRDTDM